MFLLFSLLTALAKRHDPSSEQNQIFFTQRHFEPGLDIGPVVLDKIFKVFQCIFMFPNEVGEHIVFTLFLVIIIKVFRFRWKTL